MDSLSFYKFSLVIIDSKIAHNHHGNNILLLTDLKSTLIALNTAIDSKASITTQNESFSSFTNCKIINFMRGVSVQG
jgi:hypothetical protein